MVVELNILLMKVKKVLEIDVPGLGSRIRQVREADSRSLAEICRRVGMTTMNWYRIEAEETKALPIETLKRIEEVLGVDFEIRID
ncbi:MAG: helix-turn-helix transcriptional regulator [Cyanobacteria bacterium J06641_2]